MFKVYKTLFAHSLQIQILVLFHEVFEGEPEGVALLPHLERVQQSHVANLQQHQPAIPVVRLLHVVRLDAFDEVAVALFDLVNELVHVAAEFIPQELVGCLLSPFLRGLALLHRRNAILFVVDVDNLPIGRVECLEQEGADLVLVFVHSLIAVVFHIVSGVHHREV